MTVSKQLIENIQELKKSLNEISVYDLNVYTAIELYYNIAKKLNEVVTELGRFEGVLSDEVVKQNEKLIYLLGEGLHTEVVAKINLMINEGTFDDIINHSVFNGLNNKIDTLKNDFDIVSDNTDKLLNDYTYYLPKNLEDYTELLNTIISNQTNKIKIVFPKGKTVKIGKITPISKPIHIDFNFCKIVSLTDEVMFEVGLTGEGALNSGRSTFINYVFIKGEKDPITYIKFNGEINGLAKGTFTNAVATHSLIWNYKGYGNKIQGEMRDIRVPRCVYFSHSPNELNGWSYDFNVDVDISRNYTGLGIEYEGGSGLITGVVEGCELGGVYYNGGGISSAIKIDTLYCERNKLFDIKIGSNIVDNTGATNTGNTTISNCLLKLGAGDNYKSLIYGSRQWITLNGNFITSIDKIDSSVKDTCITIIEGNINPQTLIDNNPNNLINGVFRGSVYGNNIKSKNTTITNNIISTSEQVLEIGVGTQRFHLKSNALLPSGEPKDLGGRWNKFNNLYAQSLVLFDSTGVPWSIKVSTTGVLTTTKEV